MGKVMERSLKAAEVRKLPCGAKVIIRDKYIKTVWTVIQDGRYKKLFRQDKFTGMMCKRSISDQDMYLVEGMHK